jgi:hypothetical protein
MNLMMVLRLGCSGQLARSQMTALQQERCSDQRVRIRCWQVRRQQDCCYPGQTMGILLLAMLKF